MNLFKNSKSGKQKTRADGRPTIWEYYRDESISTVEFRRLAQNINSNPVRGLGSPLGSDSNGANSQKSINSILITSAMPDEGKTLLAAHLAITMAKDEEKKVLLIDCDMRRPSIHSLFGIERKAGLSSFLEETATLEEIIKDTELEHLKIIPGGSRIPSITHLLKKEKTKELLDECKAKFDFVICDAPPVIPVHDSELLSQYVDGVVLVVLAGKTFREIVERAIQYLKEAHANVLGVVLNDIDGKLPYYYHSKYYRHYYGEREKDEPTSSNVS